FDCRWDKRGFLSAGARDATRGHDAQRPAPRISHSETIGGYVMQSRVRRAGAPARARRLVVQKTVTGNTDAQRAFSVFTEQIGRWWPLDKAHIGAQPAQTAILEQRVGGRWYERAADGAECDWGRVLVWEPPDRLVLAWEISSEWKHDINVQT